MLYKLFVFKKNLKIYFLCFWLIDWLFLFCLMFNLYDFYMVIGNLNIWDGKIIMEN